MLKKLSAYPYAQAGVTEDRNGVVLWSYSTKAAEIRRGWLVVYCLCSRTTATHVMSFIREYVSFPMSLDDVKALHREGWALDLSTGEVRNWKEVM